MAVGLEALLGRRVENGVVHSVAIKKTAEAWFRVANLLISRHSLSIISDAGNAESVPRRCIYVFPRIEIV